MSNVFKFDPNAIRERKRLNGRAPASAGEAEAARARKDARRAWLLFAGAAVLLACLQMLFQKG